MALCFWQKIGISVRKTTLCVFPLAISCTSYLESALMLNLLNNPKKSASNICFPADYVVKARKGSLYEIIPKAAPIIKRIQKELIIPVSKRQNSNLKFIEMYEHLKIKTKKIFIYEF